MRIFLTGASGYLGSALARRLVADGHEVAGLTRDAAKASKLKERGLIPVIGDLNEPRSWRGRADGCEALIHLGFEYGPRAAETDRRAVNALIASSQAARAPRLLLYTSGVWVLGPARGAPAVEADPLDPPEIVGWRPGVERAVLEASGPWVSSVVIRPGCVYGESGGLYGMMFQSALTEREVRLPGDGTNRWAGVYLDDLTELYALVLKLRPRAAVYHAVDGASDAVREVAEAFAEAAGGADVRDWPLVEARRALGPLADALAMDQLVSAAKARRELGWAPKVVSAAGHAEALLAQWEARVSPPCVA